MQYLFGYKDKKINIIYISMKKGCFVFGIYQDVIVYVFGKLLEFLKYFKLICWIYLVLKMKYVKYYLVLLYYCVKIEKKLQYEGL